MVDTHTLVLFWAYIYGKLKYQSFPFLLYFLRIKLAVLVDVIDIY